MGGHFYSGSGVNTSHVAKWNGSSWSAMGGIHGGGGLYGSISTIAIHPDTNQVYAGGDIWQVGGNDARAGIVRWTGSNWEVLPHVADSPATDEEQDCHVLTFDADGNLFAGGVWPEDGGDVNYLARWDGDDWAIFGQPVETTLARVFALAAGGDGVFAAGSFDSVNNVPANNVAFYTTAVSQVQEDSVLVVVDAENPTVGIISPRTGELIGGGVTDYVIGGYSDDITTWVKRVDLTLPVDWRL